MEKIVVEAGERRKLKMTHARGGGLCNLRSMDLLVLLPSIL